LANFSALVRSRAAIAWTMTSGCVLAGLIKVSGMDSEITILASALRLEVSAREGGSSDDKIHAIVAAPRIPNLSASALFGGGFDELKVCHNRLTMPAMLARSYVFCVLKGCYGLDECRSVGTKDVMLSNIDSRCSIDYFIHQPKRSSASEGHIILCRLAQMRRVGCHWFLPMKL
jgi:hypothetical protein